MQTLRIRLSIAPLESDDRVGLDPKMSEGSLQEFCLRPAHYCQIDIILFQIVEYFLPAILHLELRYEAIDLIPVFLFTEISGE